MWNLSPARILCVTVLTALWTPAQAPAQVPAAPSNSSKDSSSGEKPVSAGADGVSLPACSNTPAAPLTKEANAAKFHGQVIVLAVVELNGRITHIRVPKPVGLGLDESAINTLKKWKCKPAQKDGKPVLAEAPFAFFFN